MHQAKIQLALIVHQVLQYEHLNNSSLLVSSL